MCRALETYGGEVYTLIEIVMKKKYQMTLNDISINEQICDSAQFCF